MNEPPAAGPDLLKIISPGAETTFAPDGIVSRTLVQTPDWRIVLFGFAAGQELTEHTSSQNAIVQVLSGECGLTCGGKLHALKAGDLLCLPPGLPHAVKATTQFSMLLLLSKAGIPAQSQPAT